MIDASIKAGKAEKKEGASKKEKKPKVEKKDAAPAKAAEAKKSDVKKEQKKEEKPKAEQPKKADKPAALKPVEGYDPWVVLTYPHLTEKSMNLVERNNVLVFIVNMKATKAQVKEAVEKGFGARVVSVKVEITRKNQKKAYVRLAEGVLASDIATRLGMI
ncbi:MAG: 50S ribosomal protein L23 [Candidatus Aenigmarchaeota archaeon]|nr:50S ribosomal protein L23 [Candidatus Aenigmarchaeota archaeon]